MILRKKNGDPIQDNTRVSTPQPPVELLSDYNRLPRYDPTAYPPSGRVDNTFGPLDYLLGTFPIVRALTPAARAVGQALGMGSKAAPKAPPMASTARPMASTAAPEPSISFTDPMGMPTNPFLEMVPPPNPEVAFLKELEKLYATDPGGKELISTIFNATEGPYARVFENLKGELMEEMMAKYQRQGGLKTPEQIQRFQQEVVDGMLGKIRQYIGKDVAQRDLTTVSDLVDGRIIDEEMFRPYVQNAGGGRIKVLKKQ
jgi:hypothetical protein